MGFINRIFARFELWLEWVAEIFFIVWNKHKVGILGSVALNLIVIITLLALELKSRSYLHETIVLVDFERDYEILPENEPEEQQPILPEDALNPDLEYEAIQNIAVDATKEDLNPGLTDEKSIDADELYQEAQRIREQMQRNRELWEESHSEDAINVPNVEEKIITSEEEGQFKGPSVISYFLENRRALRLPVPSYKCEGGGKVVVNIEVNRDGSVARASIDASKSVVNDCINSAAVEAAKSSFFSVSASSDKQSGSITYLFVPQ